MVNKAPSPRLSLCLQKATTLTGTGGPTRVYPAGTCHPAETHIDLRGRGKAKSKDLVPTPGDSLPCSCNCGWPDLATLQEGISPPFFALEWNCQVSRISIMLEVAVWLFRWGGFLPNNGAPSPHQMKGFLLKGPGKSVSSWNLT